MGFWDLLKKLFYFTAVIALGYFSLAFCSLYKTADEINNKPVILLGDSQTEYIQNADLLNHSIHGSPFFVQYKFVQKFKDSFKNKTVIIAFNNHHLSSLYQNRMYDESLYPGWRGEMIHHYYAFDLINLWDLDFKKPNNYSLDLFDFSKTKKWFRSIFSTPTTNRNTSNEVKSFDQIKGYVHRHWQDKRYTQKDFIQIHYFNELVALLNRLQCSVYALKMPLTQEYKERIPEEFKLKYNSALSSHPEVKLLDMDSAISNQLNWSHFKDYGHLNLKGDVLLQNEIDSLIAVLKH